MIGVLALLLTAASASAALAPPASPAVGTAQAARMADLLRLWTMVRLFDTSDAADGPAWEDALADVSDEALRAPDDATLARLARRMLARIDATPQDVGAIAGTALPPPFRVEDKTVVLSCPAAGAAFLDHSLDEAALAKVAPAITAGTLIVDCTGFATDEAVGGMQQYGFDLFVSNLWGQLVSAPTSLGSIEERLWDGYPPDSGTTSGGYRTGRSTTAVGTFGPRGGTPLLPRSRAVMIVDENTPNRARWASQFRAAYGGKLVVVGTRDPDSEYEAKLPHLTVRFRAAEYRRADGKAGLGPDACVAADRRNDAIAVAKSVLADGATPGCPREAAAARGGDTASAPVGAVPSLGNRMVALARLWGTIRYFHPYEALNDRDWDKALDEFVPVFAAADTRAAYERAVMLMAARIDDSHVWMSGGTANPIVGSYAPPIYRRWLGGKLVVDSVYDAKLSDRVKPGDVIAAIDGVPATQAMQRYADLIPASTPQSRADLAARLSMIGPKDSDVRLSLLRAGRPVEVTVQRTMASRATSGRPPQTAPAWRALGGGIGYIDLTRLTMADTDKALDQLLASKVLILDMRGYPNGTAWAIAPRLARAGRAGAVNANFRRPQYLGVGSPQFGFATFDQKLPPDGGKPHFGGRVIVLNDERAISQSEHSILMFQAATPLTTIGTTTTGANGDVTNVRLPGGLLVSFSGHDVRYADGRQLQRVGIKPDIRVEPTPAGLAAGRDEVLDRAIAVARRGR